MIGLSLQIVRQLLSVACLHREAVPVLIVLDSQVAHIVAPNIVICLLVCIFGLLHLILHNLFVLVHHQGSLCRTYKIKAISLI